VKNFGVKRRCSTWRCSRSSTRCQFHQRFSRAFFVRILGAKLHFSLAPKICMKSACEKRWWNWLEDVNGYLSDREFKKFLITCDIQVNEIGYHLSITKFIDSSPNFQLNYHQNCLFFIYLFITKFNYLPPKYFFFNSIFNHKIKFYTLSKCNVAHYLV